MIRITFITSLLLVLSGIVYGQDADSVYVDTLESVVITGCDSCVTSDTVAVDDIPVDSLSEAERALADFEARRQKFRDSVVVAKPQFSYFDSLVTHFASSRLNQRESVDQSFFHDAGDYFKSDPSFFTIDHQVTPMRKTVQPFGLSGNRMNVINGSMILEPFEHIVEPDGLIDFNDVPTALDDAIYILPGPSGAVFGGDQMIATLLTRPNEPDEYTPESAFLVDKGSFAYSYARGRYNKNFVQGRKIDMSIGYRQADGAAFTRDDQSYHYRASVMQPLGDSYSLAVAGQLYDREGPLHVQPDRVGKRFDRERIDRIANVSLSHQNEEHTRKREITYSFLRQASRISRNYFGNFNYNGHGGEVAQEWISGGSILKAEADFAYRQYDDTYDKYDRISAGGHFNFARIHSGFKVAARVGGRWVEDVDFLPSASFLMSRETDNSLFMTSVGYGSRAPSLHELHMPFQQISLYGSESFDYADQGNEDLKSEKQLTANTRLELGSPGNSWILSVTGGMITDGIDWNVEDDEGSLTFTPENGDIDFVDASLSRKISITDFLRFRGGGSYHYVDYKSVDNKAYSPEYQGFGGLELHVYWPQRLIHLFAYGEVVYVGPYDGYQQLDLGQTAVLNAKLSFKMRSFRFHWIIQNVTQNAYASRDYFLYPGQYHSWGFTWDFLY